MYTPNTPQENSEHRGERALRVGGYTAAGIMAAYGGNQRAVAIASETRQPGAPELSDRVHDIKLGGGTGLVFAAAGIAFLTYKLTRK